MNIQLLPQRFDVTPLVQQLEAHPEVWNQHRWRTEHPRSPHREVDDIWVRYNAIENVGPHFNDPHEPVWYGVSESIPSARSIAENVASVRRQALGGVLITRIPPFKQVYPHVDRGWHAENTDKIGVLVQGNHSQHFCFDDVSLGCEVGDAFEFCNQFPHWVLNPTTEPRVTLIVCLRRH